MSSEFTLHASSYQFTVTSIYLLYTLYIIYIIRHFQFCYYLAYTQLDWSVGTSYILGYDVRKVSFSLYIIFMHCQIFECVRLLEELNL